MRDRERERERKCRENSGNGKNNNNNQHHHHHHHQPRESREEGAEKYTGRVVAKSRLVSEEEEKNNTD